MFRRLLLAASAVALIGTLVAVVLLQQQGPRYPAAQLDHGRPRPQGDFFRSAVVEPPTINPFTTNHAIATDFVLRYTHDGLMDQDPTDASLRPALGQSVETGDDGRTFTFKMRPGLRFSDGTPVTTEDVQFTVDVAQNEAVAPDSNMTTALREIESLEWIDERTFRVRMREQHFAALTMLATYFKVVQRRFFIDEVAALARRTGKTVPDDPSSPAFGAILSAVRLPGPGTGPYRFAADADGKPDWQPGSHLNLVQNEHSWRRAAYPESWNLAGMQLRFGLDAQGIYTALKNGEIDWQVTGDVDPELERDFPAHVYDKQTQGPYFVLWNHRPGHPTHDVRVRQALSRLFDRQAIVHGLLNDNATLAVSWFKPGTAEHPDNLAPLPLSIDDARDLLGKAGYEPSSGRKLEISILCAAEYQLLRQILEQAKPAFQAAGVELEIPVMDYGSVTARQKAGEFDGILLIKSHETWVDPYHFFASGENFMGYANPEVDRILGEARRELDAERRVRLYQEFNAIFQEEQPVTVLMFPRVRVLLDRRFRGVEVGPLGLVPERWWVEPGDRVVPVTDR